MSKILVTGAGALLGQGILRCLDQSTKLYKLISVDPDVRSTGHALADMSYKVPVVTESSYLSKLEEIITKEAVKIILIGTDVELPLFATNKNYLEHKYNLKVVVSDTSVIDIANDKWLTAEFLRKNNFPFPASALTQDEEAIEYLKRDFPYPFIAKPVDGARSKGMKIINNDRDLEKICSYKNNLVVQEMLTEEEGEYTTGCLVIDGKCEAIVSLTRDLRDGNTWRAYRSGDSPYDATIGSIAEKLGVEGPANFQYRIKNGKPVVFEINCRFSGTTPLRMMFGFNEVEALVQNYLEKTPIVQPKLKNGTILRTFSDVFVENDSLMEFESKGYTNSYDATFFPFLRGERTKDQEKF